jgi:hypothetical protein
VSTTAAVVLGGAANAGSAPAAPFSAVPAAADAAVFVNVGFGNYPRWHWDGGHRSWIHAGYGWARPGFVNYGYYGYSAPVAPPYWAQPVAYYHPYFRPYYRPAFYHPYYGYAHYGPRYHAAYFHRGYRRY